MIEQRQLGETLVEVFDDTDVPEGVPYREEYCPYYVRITNGNEIIEIFGAHDIGPETKQST